MRIVTASVIAATFLAATPSLASATEWRMVAETDGYPMTLMYVDQGTVRGTGNERTAMVMTVLEDPDSDWTHSVIRRQVNCSARTTQMLHSQFYNGETLIEDNADPSDPAEIRSGSMVEAVADVICGRGEYTSEVIADPVTYSVEYFDSGW